MKSLFFIFTFFIFSVSFGQEICDNGIDDDGDGLIDLNDDECDCEGFGGVIGSLIPNPSFEDMDCCPNNHSQLDCATTWEQASSATSDYYNTCDFTAIAGEGVTGADLSDLPDGEGWVGYWTGSGYLEYVGTCLDGPLLAGVEYTLNFHTAWGKGDANHEFSIYGTPECTDLPWGGFSCPIGAGDWELLTSLLIVYPLDGTWQEVTITFTPSVDMNAIAFGGICAGESPMRYTYIDGLILIDSESYSDISETGSWCGGDLMLEASTDTAGGTFQWFLDGVALAGETGSTIDVMLYGLGEYSAIYTIEENCLRSDHNLTDSEGVSANFEYTSICLGEETDFTNTSVYSDGVDPTWEWNFGDGSSSTEENPSHTFLTAGTFIVELIGFNGEGCNDTTEIEVTVDPNPLADFEFVVSGLSSEDGGIGGCIENTVQFNDLSTIAAPGVINSWSWDFGDGGTSTDENPTHDYAVSGTYTVVLTVETENGCTSTYTLDIIMTDVISLEIISNEPTCFGFSDGSVTVNVLGGAGDLTFEITNSADEIINIDNSNTANTLTTGWYYVYVTDGSSCSGIDSVFLDQPGQLGADLTIVNPLCYGFETGTVVVDIVHNATGSYDEISYIWTPNPGGNGGIGEDSTWAMGAGNYTLTLNDENGCSVVIDFEVTQPDSIYLPQFGFEHAYCRLFEYQSGNGVVFGSAAGGTPDYTYLWKNLDTDETDIHSTWGGLNPGDYELTVTDDNGCTLIRTLFLDSLNPEAIFTVNSDQLNLDCQGTATAEVEFINNSINYANPNNPTADTTFFWILDNPIADWQISHDVNEVFDTTYGPKGNTYNVEVCLVVLNKNGCTDTTCKILTIYEPISFEEVNIFSPNNDNINDVFTFEFKSKSIKTFYCVIVNRWGIVMHEMNSIEDGWDGKNLNGTICSDGVYFYKYEAVTDNDTPLKGQGTIQLIGGK